MTEKRDISDATRHHEMVDKDEMAMPRDGSMVQDELPEDDSPEYFATEKSVLRKLDSTMVPILWLLYIFNYLDRNNIAQARLNSFEKDLGLVGDQINVAISILNVGYMVMQLPSNMLLTRVRPSLYLPTWALIWSIVSASTAAANSFSHLVTIRFFLGIVEAPFFPGAVFLLSCYYTRREMALRTAILYSGLILATAFSGLLAAGIFSGLDGVHGLAGWQWLFIIEGAVCVGLALAAYVLLPDFPGTRGGSARWLFNEKEMRVIVRRMERDRVSETRINGSVWTGLAAAAKDGKTWIFTLMLTMNHSAYGFNNFFPSIVKGFHLGNNTITLVLTAPPYLLAALVAFAVALASDRYKERGYYIAIPTIFSCIGFIISAATLNKPARYASAFLYICGCFSSNALIFSWAANSLSQSPEKRACATAIINVLSQLGNIWSPYFFPTSQSPRYTMAMLLMMASAIACGALALLARLMLVRANKKLREQGAASFYSA